MSHRNYLYWLATKQEVTIVKILTTVLAALLLTACGQEPAPQAQVEEPQASSEAVIVDVVETSPEPETSAQVDRFADIQVLQYEVPGWDQLPLQQKKLAWYLSQAALAGRDIFYDQNYRHNLRIRKLLSAVVASYDGDRGSPAYAKLLDYAKRVWFANGIHHHYSADKMLPEFTPQELGEMVALSDPALLPLQPEQSVEDLLGLLHDPIFDPDTATKKIVLDSDVDQLAASAVNFYRDVTADEVAAFYAAKVDEDPERPVSWGLNSQLVKQDGQLVERTWKVGGMYGAAIEQIVYWLNKASEVAENDLQKAWIDQLVIYYETGDLKDYDAYNIAWVADTDSRVDTVNGFTEVYDDPLAYRGSWEAVVSIRDLEATKRIATVAAQAQWFEDHSPIMDEHKKQDVVGISAKVITIVMEGGAASPSTPIGINLPNANWIRKEHGSKSVTLGNIMAAYEVATASSGMMEEFTYREEERQRAREFGELASLLDTDLHEVIGHASGQINPGVGTPAETLKSYSSTLEEARSDLVGLYFIMDPKMMELGLVPSMEVGKASYDDNIRNGLLLQLRRIELGDDIEQAHMRNRQLIAAWVYEKGLPDKVVEKITDNGKTYFVINDYDALRELYGQLLREIQRIKSEGDYEAGAALVETYGVKIDQAIHREVLERIAPLNIAPYAGFIHPRYVPVKDDGGEIVDVILEYQDDFVGQMLEYETDYSYLPLDN
jgi:dipeptidyl-peptidase-3